MGIAPKLSAQLIGRQDSGHVLERVDRDDLCIGALGYGEREYRRIVRVLGAVVAHDDVAIHEVFLSGSR